ncbi:EF-hand calcium-binding domain-containing protein 10 [Marmota flaviventris]|uniref:EF-hand calcium-binding domain-containing protein 10 n=1 Tax=Marmota flaviventris TaxID=93162 RepID=UPI003A8B7DDB
MEAPVSREQEAGYYLKSHRILDLLNHLTSVLLFVRPENPREYLISVLECMRIAKETNVAFPYFMDNSNITAMFEMLDNSGKGTISFVQYKEALKTLGLCDADEDLKDDGHIINLNRFKEEVCIHPAFPQAFARKF